MRFCLSVPPFTDPAAVLDLARDAEGHGWDGFFLWDHLSWDGTVEAHDPWTLLGAIAVQTRRIRIGTMVTPLSRHRPAVVAKHLTTLDHLSGGRVTLGVGLGDPPDLDFADLGDEPSYRVRAAVTDEALEVVAGLLGHGSVDHRGEHLRATSRSARCRCSGRASRSGSRAALPTAGPWPAPVAGTATSRSPTPSSRPRAWPVTSARTPTTTGTSSPSGPTTPPSTTGQRPARPGWSGRSGRARRAARRADRPRRISPRVNRRPGQAVSSARSARTRPSIWSRIRRTTSGGWPAGSSSGQLEQGRHPLGLLGGDRVGDQGEQQATASAGVSSIKDFDTRLY